MQDWAKSNVCHFYKLLPDHVRRTCLISHTQRFVQSGCYPDSLSLSFPFSLSSFCLLPSKIRWPQRWNELTWVLPFESQLLQEVDVAAQELLWQSFEQHFPDGNIGVAETWSCMRPRLVVVTIVTCFSLKWFDFKGSKRFLIWVTKMSPCFRHAVWRACMTWFVFIYLPSFDDLWYMGHGSKLLYSVKRQMPLDYKDYGRMASKRYLRFWPRATYFNQHFLKRRVMLTAVEEAEWTCCKWTSNSFWLDLAVRRRKRACCEAV